MGPFGIRVRNGRLERREFLLLAASGALAASGVIGCGSAATGNDGPDDDPELLLKYVAINEFDRKAVLYGKFGTPAPGERSVSIGGQEVAIVDWDATQIKCELPLSAAGDVQVRVRETASNIRRITVWEIPMRYRFKNPEHNELVVQGDFSVRFRADVGAYSVPVRAAVATSDLRATLTASGTKEDSNCTHNWIGQEDFFPETEPARPYKLIARLRVDTATRKGNIGLGWGAPVPPFTLLLHCPEGDFTLPFMVTFGQLSGQVDFPSPDPSRPPTPLFAVQVNFGPNYQIPAGSAGQETVGLISLEWDAVDAQFPP